MSDRPPEPRPVPAREEGGPLVVTESMARLYLRQGHKALALSVYRRLASESPASEALRDAVARLEAEVREDKADRAAVSNPGPARAATVAAGPTVTAWLGEILRAAPPGDDPPTGLETHP